MKQDELTLNVFIPQQVFTAPEVTVQITPTNYFRRFDFSGGDNLLIRDGSTVTITVTTNTGTGISWGGSCTGTSGNVCTFTMNFSTFVDVGVNSS